MDKKQKVEQFVNQLFKFVLYIIETTETDKIPEFKEALVLELLRLDLELRITDD